ncbi:MAG: ATP synthase F0 subunit C [Candidatus Omnitrophica bacterium]|nr:ATP synthase F0 subunit C [Candidatus Omnitrophota bacterium]
MSTLALTILMFLSTAGPSAVIAFVGYSAVKSIARNPSASPKIFIVMILSFIFAEAIAILALLILYNLFSK